MKMYIFGRSTDKWLMTEEVWIKMKNGPSLSVVLTTGIKLIIDLYWFFPNVFSNVGWAASGAGAFRLIYGCYSKDCKTSFNNIIIDTAVLKFNLKTCVCGVTRFLTKRYHWCDTIINWHWTVMLPVRQRRFFKSVAKCLDSCYSSNSTVDSSKQVNTLLL